MIIALLEAIRKDDWTRIDAAWERTRKPWHIHLRRDAALDADGFLLDALREAQSRGILAAFTRELICEDLLTDSGLGKIALLPGRPTWYLQAFQDGEFLPVEALLEGKNLLAACDHLCRIDIDGSTRAPACRSRRCSSPPRRTSSNP